MRNTAASSIIASLLLTTSAAWGLDTTDPDREPASDDTGSGAGGTNAFDSDGKDWHKDQQKGQQSRPQCNDPPARRRPGAPNGPGLREPPDTGISERPGTGVRERPDNRPGEPSRNPFMNHNRNRDPFDKRERSAPEGRNH